MSATSQANIFSREHGRPISRLTLWIMSGACGMSVANLYYAQPLLADIGQTFHAPVQLMGIVYMSSQIGYALGLFLFVPLGDIKERRNLIIYLLLACTIALIGMAMAQNIIWLDVSSFIIGLTTIVPQMLIPLAAQWAHPKERGRAIGTLMGGLLIGIIAARTVSGLVGATFGWRAMYSIAAVLMLFLLVMLRVSLPASMPNQSMPYGQLVKSIVCLVKEQPILREASIMGAMLYGAFSVFWTTLVFFIQVPPYHYGSRVAGLFGLVGVVGAGSAFMVGKLVDKKDPRSLAGLATMVILISFVVFWIFGYRIWGLIVGVIILDMGMQAAQISNQTRIYALLSGAGNRLNTVYMVTCFLGGAIGSFLGTSVWYEWGWNGVCTTGALWCLLGIMVWALRICGCKEAAHQL